MALDGGDKGSVMVFSLPQLEKETVMMEEQIQSGLYDNFERNNN
jgi:hypothetical protein